MSIHRDLEHAASELLKFIEDLHGGLTGRIYDCQAGHPRAAAWDLERVSGTPFCWLHQQDLRNCHQDGWGCLADDTLSGPSDPAGEAGADIAERGDAAAIDLRNIERAARRILNDCNLLGNIRREYPATRTASDYERELTAGNEARCESCARFRDSRSKPYWSAPMLNGSGVPYRTTYKDTLPQPMYLCWTCHRHVERKGLLPNEQELTDHHEKGKMTCRHDDRKDEAA